MKSRHTRPLLACAVVVALLTSLLLAGCGGGGGAQGSADDALGTVSATGTGKVSAAPDIADMTFGGTTQSGDAKTALNDASKTAAAIATAIQKAGVDKKDIQTQTVSVYPITGPDSQITGYQATLGVQATVRDLKKLGDVISAATNAGATNINGPAFDVSDETPYQNDAIGRAVEDARKKADALAEAAGKSVGEVVKISTTGADSIPLPMGAAELSAADASAKVPIEPGQLDITADVTVVFDLR